MKFRTILTLLLAAALLFSFAACAKSGTEETEAVTEASAEPVEVPADAIELKLTGDGIECDSDAVFTANDIIYYEAGHDETYGAGSAGEAHTAEEAAAQTVVHITAPGAYHVTGTLEHGQLFIDLGDNAKKDETSRVTLYLDGAQVNCDVAPAVLFYRVYECGDKETFTLTPDLTNAGAVVVLKNENNVTGSHVAKIYKEGTTDKLYKFDGAFYSKMSLRIEGDGVLNVTADNEGLNSELHLQIDGGEINIFSQDDGVNTNEDGVSVTTINGGDVTISGGNGAEGDGIDSNGAIVVNGGSLYASANPQTGDGGIDADLGIYLNGGTVIATGSRNDEISTDSRQVLMDLTFANTVKKGAAIALIDNETEIFSFTALREFSALVISAPGLQFDVPYTLTVDEVTQQHGGVGSPMQPGSPGETIPVPSDGEPPEVPAAEPPAGAQPGGTAPAGDPQNGGAPNTLPSGGENELPVIPPEGIELPPQVFTPSDTPSPTAPSGTTPSGTAPTGDDRPTPPDGGKPGQGGEMPGQLTGDEEISATFTVTKENHTFRNVQAAN